MPQIHNFAVRIRIALGNFFREAVEKIAELRVRILTVIDRLIEKVPSRQRRLVLCVAAGVCVVLAMIFVVIPLLARGKTDVREVPPAERIVRERELIPPEDIFLPNEPDFVPGVILEREPRTKWTTSDAEPLWQDPLENGEEQWRNRIETTIDGIMESVP